MLRVENITKSYTTGDFTQKALDGVSLNFRKSEFVAILGPSGSGKTTFLNCIGGLDRYDSGDLIINGKSTKEFTDSDWDAYRNNTIGFIFQNYNLISHLDVLSNVEMSMTLSGISKQEKREKALEVLEKVGLKDHIHKKPTQLSGGQMQRVAIARALANNPDVILADEPTGALDTETGIQIMELIREIAADKLVIMVTHNPDLAEKYADRTVKFSDGKVTSDTNPYTEEKGKEHYTEKRTKMSFKTALSLSFNNIKTKKGRTFLTAFASSIGIIGIALILSLSDGFNIQIKKYESNALNEFPIVIAQAGMDANDEQIAENGENMKNMLTGEREFADTDYVSFKEDTRQETIHINKFSDEFMNYIDSVDPNICDNLGYTRMVTINALKKDSNGKAKWYNFPTGVSGMTNAGTGTSGYQMSGVGLASYPKTTDKSGESYLEKNYDCIAGKMPTSAHDICLVVNSMNQVDASTMQALGFEGVDGKLDFEKILGTTYKIVGNDDFYSKSDFGFYTQNTDYDKMYNSETAIECKIVGIIRLKAEQSVGLLGFGLAYSDEIVDEIVKLNQNSQLVKELQTSKVNVMDPTLPLIEDADRANLVAKYGGSADPFVIYLYPKTFESKTNLLEYIDKYNEGKPVEDTIMYIDLSQMITSLTNSIMKAITIVLVAFAAISLVVSLIMIAIITYISVLERTKEIGILRSLGARKRDISRVFTAETFIIGCVSGILGIVIAEILTIPINMIIEAKTEIANVAVLNPLYAVALIALSLILTMLGGFIPSSMAAKKDPVAALRSE